MGADDALSPDASLLFDDWPDNVLGRYTNAEGDATKRIADAPHRLEGEVNSARHQSTPLETRGYIGWWTSEWTAHVLGLDAEPPSSADQGSDDTAHTGGARSR